MNLWKKIKEKFEKDKRYLPQGFALDQFGIRSTHPRSTAEQWGIKPFFTFLGSVIRKITFSLRSLYVSNNVLVIWLIILLGFGVYMNTLGNGLFWDDNDFFVNNQYVHDLTITKIFSQNVISGSGLHSNYYRPVLSLVFSIEWFLFDNWPPGFHLVNMIFHIADGILLYLILLALFRKKSVALLTTIIFVVHPLQTEAVSYANSLGDSLSVFCILFGLYNFLEYLKTHIKSKLWWALVFYILAIFSKEIAIIMPTLVLLVWWYQKDSEGDPLNLQKEGHPHVIGTNIVKEGWPFLVIASVYVLLRGTVLNFGGTFNLYQQDNVFTSSIFVRIFTFFKSFLVYLNLIFWPHDLHMERSVDWGLSIFNMQVMFGGIIFIALLLCMFWSLKKRSLIGFGLAWFFIALAPTSNILVPINGLLYEHWLYLPLAGISFSLFYVLNLVWDRFLFKSKYLRNISLIMLCTVICVLCILTIKRNRDWHDPITFYNQTLIYSPYDYRITNNLAMEYAGRDINDKAEEFYLKAIHIDGTNPVSYYNLGNLYLATGKQLEAEKQYIVAVEKDPHFVYAYIKLVNINLARGDKEQAQKWYDQYNKFASGEISVH